MNKAIVSFSLAAIWAMGIPVASEEANRIQVGKSKTMEVDAFGVCRKVTNDGPSPIMVPIGSALEWSSGSGSFLKNLSTMDGVTVEVCGEWYDGLVAGVAEFSDFHNTIVVWKDGTNSTVVNGSGYPGPSVGKQGAVVLQSAKYYNASTGACAPAKSYIGTGAIISQVNSMGWITFAYNQLCNSDGTATGPFPTNPIQTFDNR